MTMISCSVLELAIGLERMSPLGIVAATGLILGLDTGFSSWWLYAANCPYCIDHAIRVPQTCGV